VAYSAFLLPLFLVSSVDVAEETDIHRNLHVFSLYNIRMAAPAMQLHPADVLHKMGFMVKDDIPLRENHLRFNEPSFMAARLQTVPVGNICQWSWIVGAGHKLELSGKRVQETVLVAFKARYHLVCRPLPFIVIRSDEMAEFADNRSFDHDFLKKKIGGRQEYR